jgi:hypothetical protein
MFAKQCEKAKLCPVYLEPAYITRNNIYHLLLQFNLPHDVYYAWIIKPIEKQERYFGNERDKRFWTICKHAYGLILYIQ